jgi:hypothetical protein
MTKNPTPQQPEQSAWEKLQAPFKRMRDLERGQQKSGDSPLR